MVTDEERFERVVQGLLAKSEPVIRHIIRNADKNATGLREAEEALFRIEQKRREDESLIQMRRHEAALSATAKGTAWGRRATIAAVVFGLAAIGLAALPYLLPPRLSPPPNPVSGSLPQQEASHKDLPLAVPVEPVTQPSQNTTSSPPTEPSPAAIVEPKSVDPQPTLKE